MDGGSGVVVPISTIKKTPAGGAAAHPPEKKLGGARKEAAPRRALRRARGAAGGAPANSCPAAGAEGPRSGTEAPGQPWRGQSQGEDMARGIDNTSI